MTLTAEMMPKAMEKKERDYTDSSAYIDKLVKPLNQNLNGSWEVASFKKDLILHKLE